MTTKKPPQPTVDLGYPTESHGKIPAFNSIEEEAEFWDTHDFIDFEEFDPAELSEESLTVVLATSDRDELDRRAEEMGVKPSALVRMWIEERLHKEAS